MYRLERTGSNDEPIGKCKALFNLFGRYLSSLFFFTFYLGWLGTFAELSFGSWLYGWIVRIRVDSDYRTWDIPYLDHHRSSSQIPNRFATGQLVAIYYCSYVIIVEYLSLRNRTTQRFVFPRSFIVCTALLCFSSTWCCIYMHALLRILKFLDSVHQESEQCIQII